MKKVFVIAAAAAAFAFSVSASAQTNLQMFYDAGRGYATTTFEMFKGDNWGNTFFFIDHYYPTASDRESGKGSAINGSYFELERCLNFWQDSKLGNLSIQVEYDGATWGAGNGSVGLNYFMHSADFSNTFNVALLYNKNIGGKGVKDAQTPVKFTGVWGIQDLFGLAGLRFSGFIDVWGNDCVWADGETHMSILTEPQLWYNIGKVFNCDNLHIGGEVELSYNFAGNEGFMCNPCVGFKWAF